MNIEQILQRYPFFANLTSDQRRKILSITKHAAFETGEYMFRENDMADYLYLITGGKVDTSQHLGENDNRQMHVTTLTEGDVLGWSAVIGKRRAATARAQESVKAIAIDGSKLKVLMAEDVGLKATLMEKIANVIYGRMCAMSVQFASIFASWSEFVKDQVSRDRM